MVPFTRLCTCTVVGVLKYLESFQLKWKAYQSFSDILMMIELVRKYFIGRGYLKSTVTSPKTLKWLLTVNCH